MTLSELDERLREIFATRREKTLFIIGAGTLRYGEIITVLDAAKGAGVEKSGSSPRACAGQLGATGLYCGFLRFWPRVSFVTAPKPSFGTLDVAFLSRTDTCRKEGEGAVMKHVRMASVRGRRWR